MPDKPRLAHIDILRGLIIVFMILDHAMVYCVDYFVNDPMDVPGTKPKVFISRFISHFCAPLFVFLAGFSAALTEQYFDDRQDFARQDFARQDFAKGLIIRGAVLILFEFTIVSWSWSFNPLYPMLYAQVIWAIGWGFIGLGVFHLCGLQWVFVAGVLIVFGHNLLDGISFESGTAMHYLWSILHQKNVLILPFEFRVRTTYPVLPIIGLMCLAYLMGRYYVAHNFSKQAAQWGLYIGIACLLAYGLLRGFNLYGDTGLFVVHDSLTLTLMSFFNPTKYPLSLQFMLLTVGSGLIALFYFKQLRAGFSAGFLQMLGRTSMFSYIAHLYILHLMSWLLIPFMGFAISDMTYGETLIGLPAGFGLSYSMTYLFAATAMILTLILAKLYLPWKLSNKHNFIARYI